ncbi:hypothetical protein Tco_0434498 [Tanacetum coccineum]
MAPKRTTRSTPATTTTTPPVTNAQLKALIDQGVTDALVAHDADRSRNGNDSHNSGTSGRRIERTARECTYTDFLKCQPLNFKGTEGNAGLSQYGTLMSRQLVMMPRTDLKVKGTDLTSYTQRFQELALLCGRMFPEESDKIENTLAERQAENKRKLDNNNQAQQQAPKKQGVAIAYTAGSGERKEYAGTLPLCNKCKFTFINNKKKATCLCKVRFMDGQYDQQDCRSHATTNNQRNPTCYECWNQGNYRSDCPKLKNQNLGNQTEGTEARGMVHALGGGEINQDLNNMENDINA